MYVAAGFMSSVALYRASFNPERRHMHKVVYTGKKFPLGNLLHQKRLNWICKLYVVMTDASATVSDGRPFQMIFQSGMALAQVQTSHY